MAKLATDAGQLINGNLAQIPRVGKRTGADGIIARAMDAPHARADARSRYAEAILFVACVAIACVAALRLHQDANWDLQNYHFYDPWAWLTGRSLAWDLAAAQLQTFHNPLADVPFYLLVAGHVDPRAITAWLALPAGLARYFFAKIAWLLFGDLRPAQRAGAAAAAAAIGFTGAMGVGQLGSTTDEWLVTAFTMAASWLLVREATPPARRKTSTLVLAGLAMGVASGLKLTAATYAVGLCVALAATRSPVRDAVRAGVLYCIGIAAGLAVALGPWSYQLWIHFRNPLFPYGNRWFRSPWWDLESVLPPRFGPHTLGDWLLFPFKLLAPTPGFVSEMPYVDARLPLLCTLALIAVIGHGVARAQRTKLALPPGFETTAARWRWVSTAFVASFVVWALLHSILRYAIPLEILSGLLIVGLLGYLLRPPHASAAIACTLAALAATTVWSNWGRVEFGRAWFDVRVPPVEPNALVLLTVDAPMAYVLPFFPRDSRHVGLRNNINDPSRRNLLAKTVAAVVREHRGPLYALSYPKGQGDADLRAHHLRRVAGACADVVTNMPTSPIELCRLERTAAP
jgi:hypothetical protein